MIAGRYRVERKIGAGGMGVVVAAIDEQTGFRVAIKLLLPEGPTPSGAYANAEDSGVIERSNRHQEMSTRLIREASAASRLSSDHVTRVLDVGRLDSGDPYVVMELLEGVDLGRYAKQRGPLGVTEAVNLVLQACEAIFEAHALGIVHRDLKPANLFLTQKADGTPFVKVLDFGISKVLGADDNQLTATSDMLGSPLYMAPEQIRNARDVDVRADVWSLGTILYRLLAGRAAFESQGSAATLAAIIGDQPYPLRGLRPDVPPDLEGIVLRCLEKDRTRRIQTVRELAIALQRFAIAQSGSMLPAAQIGAMASLPAMTPHAGMPLAGTPAGAIPSMTPGGGMPSLASVAPNSITVSGPRSRPAAMFAAAGVMAAAMIGGGLLAWKLVGVDAPAPDAPGASGATSASGAASAPSSATVAEPPASSAAAPASASASAEPSSAPSAAATAAATATATASASGSAKAPPRVGPIPGKRSDDPLGDRL